MSWLTRLRPKLKFLQRRETPDNLWHKCRSCGQMIYRKAFEDALSVCSHCGTHERLGAAARFTQIFDEGRYTLVEVAKTPDDPLKFRDQKRYSDRLKDARAKQGMTDALQVATGTLAAVPVVIAVQDFHFMAGSMGSGVGEAFVTAVRTALATRRPFVAFTAAGGARMQEGMVSLMQMPRTVAALAQLRDAGLPFIVVLTDPTTGGVTASYAMLGDVHLAEPGALIGFAGPRVIESTIREKLPDGFQRAEYLRDHGMVDQVVPRAELKDRLGRILNHLMGGQGALLSTPSAAA